MSSAIIFSTHEYVSHYYDSILRNAFDLTCTIVDTPSDFEKAIRSQQSLQLIVVDYQSLDANNVISYTETASNQIPHLIIAEQEALWQAKKEYKSKTLWAYLQYQEAFENIQNIVQKMLRARTRQGKEKEYSKVNLNFFYSANEVFCDVYLKLKDNKYVKIFNRYDQIEFEDLRKYQERNIHYLYVRQRDFKLITKLLVKHLKPRDHEVQQNMQLMKANNINSMFSVQLQETAAQSIHTLGLNEDTVELTCAAINNTIELIEQSPGIHELLRAAISGRNYISEHSFLTSFLASAVCSRSEYNDEENILALTVASFFHDISLKEDYKARVQQEGDKAFARLGIEEQEEVLTHPEKSAETAAQIEGIPPKAITIIEQHHEAYDGTGFPNGLDFKTIKPMSALFNLCHEITVYLYEAEGDREQIEAILEDMQAKYPRGSYAKFLAILHQILIEDTREAYQKAIAS